MKIDLKILYYLAYFLIKEKRIPLLYEDEKNHYLTLKIRDKEFYLNI